MRDADVAYILKKAPLYRTTKYVRALQIIYMPGVDGAPWELGDPDFGVVMFDPPAGFVRPSGPRPAVGDRIVIYPEGYVGWVPREAWDRTAELVEDESELAG